MRERGEKTLEGGDRCGRERRRIIKEKGGWREGEKDAEKRRDGKEV